MLLKLMMKNIRYYIKNYFVYIMSISLNVWIYFTFMLFMNSSIGMGIMGQKTYGVLMNTASKTILIFTMFFIYYSTNFFIRKRSREIGIYQLLGINKSKISLLLYFETVAIGMVGVLIGITVGWITKIPVLTNIYKLIYEKPVMMGSDIIVAGNVILYFFAIFTIISLFNIRIIKKSQLIDLFKKENKEQKPVKVRAYKIILSIIIVISGYVMIFQAKNSETIVFLPIGLIFILIGMFLTFKQIITGICSYLRKTDSVSKNFVARVNLNTLLYRINENSFLLTVVSLLISASISLTTIGFATNASSKSINKTFHPFSYIYVTKDENSDKEINKIIEKSGLERQHQSVRSILLEYTEGYNRDSDIKRKIRIIRNGDLLKLSKLEKVDYNKEIKQGNCVLLAGDYYLLGKDLDLKSKNRVLNLKVEGVTQYNPIVLENEAIALAVSDLDFDRLTKVNKVETVQCYDLKDSKNIDDVGISVARHLGKESNMNLITFEDILVTNLTKILIFVMILISISLLSSIGSMLYFWILSEIKTEEKSYSILYCIGADRKIIKRVIRNQVGLSFIIPYLVSSVNIILMTKFLQERNLLRDIIPTILGVGLYSIIYIIYYVLTNISANKMIINIDERK